MCEKQCISCPRAQAGRRVHLRKDADTMWGGFHCNSALGHDVIIETDYLCSEGEKDYFNYRRLSDPPGHAKNRAPCRCFQWRTAQTRRWGAQGL